MHLWGGGGGATDLSEGRLWRTSGKVADLTAVRLPGSPDAWRPVWRDDMGNVQPWNDEVYQNLRKTMESLPPGSIRHNALDRIRSLDCANPTLASCDPVLPPPVGAAARRKSLEDAYAWRKSLEGAGVDDAAYAKALAAELKALVCSGGKDAIYVLRGLGFRDRLAGTGPEAPALADFIMSKESRDCPVSALLTDADKAELIRIKQDASKKPGG